MVTDPATPGPAAQILPPRLCVGLPVYNGDRFLEEALDSVLSQTFADFELIVCDNASEDDTPRIVERYMARDARIHYLRHERNIGASANFLAAWQQCRSVYFKWMAGDDLCDPRFFAACVEALDARPEAGLVYPKAAFVDEDSTILYTFDRVVDMPAWSSDRFERSRQVIDVLLRDGSTANVMVFGVIRASVLENVAPIGNYFGADLPFVAELAMAAEVVGLDETLSFYRRHDGSSSSYVRSPSASDQQDFYDPSVQGRLRLQWNLRRRYFELLKVVFGLRLPLVKRLALGASVATAMARRLRWRVRFELDMARGSAPEPPTWSGEARHWTEFPETSPRP
jgi:glycosyltransferase involved in cell wall biosynthesis